MKLWIDDIRPAPKGYVWLRSTNKAIEYIRKYSDWLDWDMQRVDCIELIDIDHDAGMYARDGGDYIKILDWLEEQNMSYPIHIHSMNPVGIENMRRIIRKNGWREV